MDTFPITIRLTATEKQMLRKRAGKYGLTINSLIRFWVNSEPSSPRAFSKVKCKTCNATGKIAGEYLCNNCRGAGFNYYEI
jgi:RecJ-like exonuclease